jgi:hypothetical protein
MRVDSPPSVTDTEPAPSTPERPVRRSGTRGGRYPAQLWRRASGLWCRQVTSGLKGEKTPRGFSR